MSRPRLCIAQPGMNYSARNAYTLALPPLTRALRRHFDVSLLFRSVLEPVENDLPVATVLSTPDVPETLSGSARNYFIGGSIGARRAYLRQLGALPPTLSCDFLLERQWRHVGHLTSAAARAGIAAGLVSEGEFYNNWTPGLFQDPRAALRNWADRVLEAESRARGYRAADLIFPETEVQKDQIARWFGPQVADKSVPIAVGIDPDYFQPRDRLTARAALGWAPDGMNLVYIGSLNGSIQSPDQIIEGLARAGRPEMALHIVGAGDRKEALEARAKVLGVRVRFYGFVPQARVGAFIAAADLTLAPYRAELYRDGVFTSASCKIREYLASGRPVVTIPGKTTRDLTGYGRYGFLLENRAQDYAAFFCEQLTLGRLREKESFLLRDLALGLLRKRGITPLWDDIGEAYAEAILRVIARKKSGKSTDAHKTRGAYKGSTNVASASRTR